MYHKTLDEIYPELGMLLESLGVCRAEDAAPGLSLLGEGGLADSLAAARLVTEVERNYGVDIVENDLDLECLRTVGSLAGYIAGNLPRSAAGAAAGFVTKSAGHSEPAPETAPSGYESAFQAAPSGFAMPETAPPGREPAPETAIPGCLTVSENAPSVCAMPETALPGREPAPETATPGRESAFQAAPSGFAMPETASPDLEPAPETATRGLETVLSSPRSAGETVVGWHLILDCSNCPPETAENLPFIRKLLRALAGAAKVAIVEEAYHEYAPYGITGLAIVSESHISLHTWPEYDYLGVDIFSCREIDAEAVGAALKAAVPGVRIESRYIKRSARGV